MKLRTAAAAALAAGAAGALVTRRRSVRAARNLALARVGSRVGVEWAGHRARRVFASAARKDELDAAFELRSAEQVVAALGNMKGALMKIGQMASYVDESIPAPIREALAQLQQDAPPMSPELSAQVVEQELGRTPEAVFAEWDPVPIAAASIGQVHRAMTHDGVAVAVKVQYPGVDEAIQADLANTAMLTNTLGMLFPGFDAEPFVAEMRDRVIEELDYRLEADNQRLFADYYAGHPFISVPRVLGELSTGRVLTTELAAGARFAELDGWSQDERNLAGETIFRFVFRSLYRMHAFNGDPHPGNYLFEPGGRVTFLDFGLVKRFTPSEVATFERMAQALVVNHDLPEYRSALEDAGVLKPGAPMSDERLVEYFGYFYDSVIDDREYTFTTTYASEAVNRLMPMPGTEFPEIRSFGNLPPAFVIIQRINLGMTAVLAHLNATANFRRIGEECWPFTDAPPSTELGRQEAAWSATRQ